MVVKVNYNEYIKCDLSSPIIRDNYIKQIEDKIRSKKQFLFHKYKDFCNTKNTNSNKMMDDIKDFYKDYHSKIIQEKNDQTQAFKLLNQYLENIIKDGKLSDEEVENAKNEQKHIIDEIVSIKNEIGINI